MSGKPDFQIPLEPERYELAAPPAYRFEVDRREFFKFLGAGILIVGVLKNAHAFQESGAGKRPDESLPKEIGAWLHIGENGAVTVYTGKVEVGQNIRTSLSQCVADPHYESTTEESCRGRSQSADWFGGSPMADRWQAPGRR